MRNYSKLLTFYNFNAKRFFDNVARTKAGYVIFHFVLVTLLLFLPIFFVVARTPANVVYSRIYGVSIGGVVSDFLSAEELALSTTKTLTSDTMGVLVTGETDEETIFELDKTIAWFCFSDELVAYVDGNNRLAAPREAFAEENIADMEFIRVFDIIAHYNGYQLFLLLPILGVVILVIMIMQIVFYLVVGYFLGMSMIMSAPVEYSTRVKLAVFCSTHTAILSLVAGFFMPVLHIVIFQLATMFLSVYMLKNYDMPETKHLY